jgi:hypothetical protein
LLYTSFFLSILRIPIWQDTRLAPAPVPMLMAEIIYQKAVQGIACPLQNFPRELHEPKIMRQILNRQLKHVGPCIDCIRSRILNPAIT